MVFREVLNGWTKRVRLENSVALQKAMLVRPAQVQLECSSVLRDINVALKSDKELKAVYDSIRIQVPSFD